MGIILNPLMVTLKEKQRDIMMSVRIATEEFGADSPPSSLRRASATPPPT